MKYAPTKPREVPAPPPGAASDLSPVERLVVDVARALDTQGIPHAFLRGHAHFPRLRAGSDVDLCLRGRDAAAFEELLLGACQRGRVTVLERFRAGFLRQYLLHSRDEGGRHAFLALDLHGAEAHMGVPFLDADQILSGRRDAKGLRVPEEGTSALVDFLGPLLSGGVVRAAYAQRLARVAGSGTGDLLPLATWIFGRRQGQALLAEVGAGDRVALRRRAPALRRTLLMRCFLRAPLGSLGALVSFAFGVRVRARLRPRGLFVALIGTDGAGKSALAEGLAQRLEGAFRSAESGTWHLRPGLLPQLDRLVHLGRATYGPEDMTRPHRAAPSGRLVSNLRVAWYAIDYLVGYAVRILPRRRRRSLILFDRYFYDYLVDPLRCRVRHGTLLARLLAPLVPRPDAVLVVTADLEHVRSRKQELPREESRRQLAAYEALAEGRDRFHVVRNDGPLEQTVDAALDTLFPGRTA